MLDNNKFNIYDLNFILTFAGFSIFTSISESISSVIYRGIALLVAILCLFCSNFKSQFSNKYVKYYMVILLLICLRVTYDVIFGEYSDQSYDLIRPVILLFTYGIVLIPVFASATNIQKVNWKNTLWILEILLLAVVLMAVRNTYSEDAGVDGRFMMNARQSTLVFGDNASYLLILSLVLYNFFNIENKFYRRVGKLLCLLGVLVSIYGIAKSGSRGPLVGAVAGVLFMVFKMPKSGKFKIIFVFLLAGFFGLFSSSFLQTFAPALYERINMTIVDKDMGGRDELYDKCLTQLHNHPFTGGSPIDVDATSFTSWHNCYLDVAMGLGVIGGFLFILLNIIVIKRIFKTSTDNYVMVLMASLFIVNAARALTGVSMISNAMYSLIFTFTCAMFFCDYNNEKNITK